jgi:DUF4097 and DUF4098 domain-containing protein YvlB
MLSVVVRGSARLDVEGRGEDIPDSVEVKHERRGGVLHVWVEKRFGIFSFGKDGTLYFDVPAGIELDIRSASGSVDISDMNSSRLFAGSSSGNVALARIRSDLEVRSSSGDIDVVDVRGDIAAGSSSGRIDIRNVQGKVGATVSSGNVGLSDVKGDIDITSSSGGIRLNTTDGSITARTSSGDIIGNGVWISGNSAFRSSSGNINIDFDNPLAAFTFELSSSSGSLRTGDVSGEKNLVAGVGVLHITGETSSGDQRYR